MTPEKKGFAKSPKGHTLLVTFALSSANFRPRIAARAIFERSGGDATMSTEYFFLQKDGLHRSYFCSGTPSQ